MRTTKIGGHSPGTMSVGKFHKFSRPLPRWRVGPAAASHATTAAEALREGSEGRYRMPHHVELEHVRAVRTRGGRGY